MNLIDITPAIYQDVAQRFCDELDGEDKSIEMEWSDSQHDYKFEISFVDYSNEEHTRVVPTWWEFHTYTSKGEVLNNFQFKKLRGHIN